MKDDELSKRWIVNFRRDRVIQNIQFFRNSLNVEPIVIAYWSKGKCGGYVVAEPGMKAWDITEPHLGSYLHYGKPGDAMATEFTASEFETSYQQRASDWYDYPPDNKRRKVWEPFDEKRGIKGYINCVYQESK